jgi:hypothetical protein
MPLCYYDIYVHVCLETFILRISQQKITVCIQRLGYNFNQFVLRDFIVYVAQQRGRPIYIRRRDLSQDLFGAWLPAVDVDYIYINKKHHGLQQVHTTIHELAHILLDHPCRPIDRVLAPELYQLLETEILEGCARYVPTMQMEQTSEEQEAEEFVFQIQARVMHADRLRELTAVGTSIETLLPMVNTSES